MEEEEGGEGGRKASLSDELRLHKKQERSASDESDKTIREGEEAHMQARRQGGREEGWTENEGRPVTRGELQRQNVRSDEMTGRETDCAQTRG